MNDTALASFREPWLAVHPELALALPYVPADDRDARVALGCLERQILDMVHGIADPGVAASKLGWWADELANAHAGQPRHPLTQALFADARAATLRLRLWQEPLRLGLALRDCPPAADFAKLLASVEPLHAALGALENAFWFGGETDAARIARLASLGHLLRGLGRLGQAAAAGPLVVPMNLLARHGLPRETLGNDSVERGALLRDQLGILRQAWTEAATCSGRLTLFRATTARADELQLRRALRARDPLASLVPGRHRAGPAMAWFVWREARRRIGHPST